MSISFLAITSALGARRAFLTYNQTDAQHHAKAKTCLYHDDIIMPLMTIRYKNIPTLGKTLPPPQKHYIHAKFPGN